MHLKSNKQQAFLFLMLTDNIMMADLPPTTLCVSKGADFLVLVHSSWAQIIHISNIEIWAVYFLYEKERSTDKTIHCWRHFVYFWCVLVKYPRQSHFLWIQRYRWINHIKKVFIEPWIGTNGALPAVQNVAMKKSHPRGKKQQLPSVIFRPNAVPMRCQFGFPWFLHVAWPSRGIHVDFWRNLQTLGCNSPCRNSYEEFYAPPRHEGKMARARLAASILLL
jgi:hypothetical protein